MTSQILVRRYGKLGPPVVVLHGGPGAPGSAQGLARLLEPHFQSFEPLQRRADDVALTVGRHVDDLAEVAPRAAIVGWSWGAMLGLSYAARHPEKVTALVLVGCGTYSEEERRLYRARLDHALGDEGRRRRDALTVALARAQDGPARDRLLADLGALAEAAQNVAPLDDGPREVVDVDARGHEETWRDVLRLQAEGL